jgi:hypothetical protein
VGKSKRHAAEMEGISKQGPINPSPGIVFMEKQVFLLACQRAFFWWTGISQKRLNKKRNRAVLPIIINGSVSADG